MKRQSQYTRKTAETDISLTLNIDGKGKSEIDTGIGFFDHMLTLFAKHGLFDFVIKVSGDLYIDGHHSVEDAGIVLGLAIKEALGDKKSIKRYGTSFVTMDESLAMVSLDLSGRAFLVYNCDLTCERVGQFDTELVEEFFRAVAFNAGITLHINVHYGKNNHHIIEAIFKAFGRALREASTVDNKIEGVMSTKGTL